MAGHRTSVSLENEFWDALGEFARADGVPVNYLIARVDSGRTRNLSSALRVYVLERLRGDAAPD